MSIHPLKFLLKKTSLASLMSLSNLALYAEDHIPQLTPIMSQAAIESELQQQLKQSIGATNFIDPDHVLEQHQANLADIFQRQAGVYAQSAGNEGIKLSLRGSGLNRGSGAHASGTFTLLDDIALTGPGGTPYELLEPWWIDEVAIYRGANGFEKGALALGGAINYVSPTGKTQQSHRLSYEIGSDGYQKYAFSTADKIDHFDYYLSLVQAQSDGFQHHAATQSQGLMLNMGYQWNHALESRVYVRYRETEHQTPGRLTYAQIQNDPNQANEYYVEQDAQRIQPGSTWLANQTLWQISADENLKLSLAYHRYPMDLQESPYQLTVNYNDLTAQLQYETRYAYADILHKSKISLRSTTHRPDSVTEEFLRRDTQIDGQKFLAGQLIRQFHHLGSDHVVQYDHEADIHANLTLQFGLAGIYAQRSAEVTLPINTGKVLQQHLALLPRFGVLYRWNDQLHTFAHISRSFEPAHPWSMIWSSNSRFPSGSGAATGRQSKPVMFQPQTATSFEIGTRGNFLFGQWDVSYYYADIQHELLNTEVKRPNEAAYIAESNASPTVHQGLELAVYYPIWQSQPYGQMYLHQTYTLSDFYYQHDEKFGQNQLAGIPKHLYQAKLGFDHRTGWSIALHTEYASSIAADYANSHGTEPYHLWGMQLGYQDMSEQWQCWLDLRNLFNKKYAATVTPGYDDQGQDTARYTPGMGFSGYFGISFQF